MNGDMSSFLFLFLDCHLCISEKGLLSNYVVYKLWNDL